MAPAATCSAIDFNLKPGEEISIWIPRHDQPEEAFFACEGVVDLVANEAHHSGEGSVFHLFLRSAPQTSPYYSIYYDPETLKCDIHRTATPERMKGKITRKT